MQRKLLFVGEPINVLRCMRAGMLRRPARGPGGCQVGGAAGLDAAIAAIPAPRLVGDRAGAVDRHGEVRHHVLHRATHTDPGVGRRLEHGCEIAAEAGGEVV